MVSQKKKIHWTSSSIFLISYHTFLAVTLPFYFYYSSLHTGTMVSAFVLLWLTGLSITGGYHRFFAHKAFKAHPIFETMLLFFGTMACQSSVLRWAYDHRRHHAFVDTDKDPYSINKGFWYAHFMWMMEKHEDIDPKVVPDLMKNKMVMFQHNYYPFLMVGTNLLAFLCVGFAFHDFWGAFFIATLLRMFTLHHCTWFINSLAHTWGSKQFSQEQTAVDNFIIALLTFGEGYHNYHHTFANDYRNGIRWFHFDPTKWLIWGLSKLGLAHSLKRTDKITIKKRIVLEHRSYLIETVAHYWHDKRQELEKQVHDLSESILNGISEFAQLKERYLEFQNKEQLSEQLKELKKRLRDDWRQWKALSHSILNERPTVKGT